MTTTNPAHEALRAANAAANAARTAAHAAYYAALDDADAAR